MAICHLIAFIIPFAFSPSLILPLRMESQQCRRRLNVGVPLGDQHRAIVMHVSMLPEKPK
jgi:hypothetical protein